MKSTRSDSLHSKSSSLSDPNPATKFPEYPDNPAGVSKTIGVTVIPLVVPAMSNATWTSNTFALGFESQPCVTYQLQQTTNLAPPTVWTPVKSIVGDGAFRTMTDTTATNQMRFYRLWLQ